jgi:NDP-sugar pyrophosphorylase family protein
MNTKLIIPMAGDGSRFAKTGYTSPKPMIDIDGKPMFVRAVESIGINFDGYVFITKQEHELRDEILQYYPTANIVEISSTTEGAACTVLLADAFVNDDDSVFVTNCDQLIEWDMKKFEEQRDDADGIIMLFHEPDRNPKWSFAAYEPQSSRIYQVAEKDPISEWATSGHYYWKSWKVFKDSANMMINDNDRVNGEFYLCPVFNHTLRMQNTVIKGVEVDKMIGLGTPEDLSAWRNS